MAKLQGVFAVLEQVDREKTNEIKTGGATSTFWGMLGKALLDKAKIILKQKYCSENHEIRALLQELISDSDMPEDDDKDSGEGNVQAVAALKPLIQVLENIDAMATQYHDAKATQYHDAKATQYSTTNDYSAKTEGWLNDIKEKIEEKIRAFAKKNLC